MMSKDMLKRIRWLVNVIAEVSSTEQFMNV